METNTILSLLGLNEKVFRVADEIIETDDSYLIFVETREQPDSRVCPYCNKKENVVIKDYKTCEIVHSVILLKKKVKVLLKKRRYLCKSCHKTFTEKINFCEPHAKISNDTMWAIRNQFLQIQSFSTIAENFKLSVPTVISIFEKMVKVGRSPLTKCIYIDEFKFKVTQYNKFPCVISDFKTGRILDIIESRKEAYLSRYLNLLSPVGIGTVKYFVSDLNETYRTIKKKFFPKAVHIVDHFHVSKLFTTVVNVLRARIMKSYTKDSFEYKFLKKNWKYFLANPVKNKILEKERVDQNGEISDFREAIKRIMFNHQELLDSYDLYCDFNRYFVSSVDYEDAKLNLEFLIQKAFGSTVKEIITLGETLLNWSEEILNSYSVRNKLKISNAVAESNNNKIKKLINVSYGYGSFQRLRKRVLFIEKEKSAKES